MSGEQIQDEGKPLDFQRRRQKFSKHEQEKDETDFLKIQMLI